MLDYNTIFFAECQDGNGFLFHFVNFVQTQVIFYSKLTSKNLPFLLSMCSCFQSRSLRRKLCSISQLITFTKDGQELLPYARTGKDRAQNGRRAGGLPLFCPSSEVCCSFFMWSFYRKRCPIKITFKKKHNIRFVLPSHLAT